LKFFHQILSIFVAACILWGITGPTLYVHYCSQSESYQYKLYLIPGQSDTNDQTCCSADTQCEADTHALALCCSVKEDANMALCCTEDEYEYRLEDVFNKTEFSFAHLNVLSLIDLPVVHLDILTPQIATVSHFRIERAPPFKSIQIFKKNMIWLI
jgi:hypothetical protein